MSWNLDKQSGWQITADKLHDFLMNPKSRPDLQTDEGKTFLDFLEKNYHNDKTDALMPWVVREWKKGRLEPGFYREARPFLHGPLNENEHIDIDPMVLNHWGDFLQSNHPLRRGMGDIMQKQLGDFHGLVNNWDQDMEDKANAEEAEKTARHGKTVHQWPDNWTVRQLTEPEELTAEGDAMGHCVGSYQQSVRNGETLIYSLRDPKGHPHATAEIKPPLESEWNRDAVNAKLSELGYDPRHYQQVLERHKPHEFGFYHKTTNIMKDFGLSEQEANNLKRISEDPELTTRNISPENGEVVQVQGKSNHEPNEEYREMLREWMNTIPGLHAETREIRDPSELRGMDQGEYYDENPYGHSLETDYELEPRYRYDWLSILKGMDWDRRHAASEEAEDDPEMIHEHALMNGEIPQLGKAHDEIFPQKDDRFHRGFEHHLDQVKNDYIRTSFPNQEHYKTEEEYLKAQKEMFEGMPEVENQAKEEYERRNPSYSAFNRLDNLLEPHRHPLTGEYQNEPYPPQGEQLTFQ